VAGYMDAQKFEGKGSRRISERGTTARSRGGGRGERGIGSQVRRVETATRVCTILSATVYGRECVTNKCLPAAKRTGICIRTHNVVEKPHCLMLAISVVLPTDFLVLPLFLSFFLSSCLVLFRLPFVCKVTSKIKRYIN